jgi:hypothetical protein
MGARSFERATVETHSGIVLYKHHGRLSLLAGIDPPTGKVHACVEDRPYSREFISFLKCSTPPIPRTAIKLILHNHSASVSKETKAWLADQPEDRFFFVSISERLLAHLAEINSEPVIQPGPSRLSWPRDTTENGGRCRQRTDPRPPNRFTPVCSFVGFKYPQRPVTSPNLSSEPS